MSEISVFTWVAGTAMLTMTVRMFWHIHKLRTFDSYDRPRWTRRWSAQLLRLTGWWQCVVGLSITSFGAQDDSTMFSSSFTLFAAGLGLVLWGQAKNPTASFMWVARRWRPLRALIWLAR